MIGDKMTLSRHYDDLYGLIWSTEYDRNCNWWDVIPTPRGYNVEMNGIHSRLFFKTLAEAEEYIASLYVPASREWQEQTRYVAEAACALENLLKGEMDTAEIHLATTRLIDSLVEKLEATNA